MSIKIVDGFCEIGEQIWYVGFDWAGNFNIYHAVVRKVYNDRFYGELVDVMEKDNEDKTVVRRCVEKKDLVIKYFKNRENAELYYVGEIMIQ